MQRVWISWNGQHPTEYSFVTLPELNAFLKGITEVESNCSIGGQYEQFDTFEEWAEKNSAQG